MVDITDAATRSRMMAGIQGKNTSPEMHVRRALYSRGYRYRLHVKKLPGSPDIVMRSKRVAIFVNGCFWHRHAHCRFAKLPATRPEFWSDKLGKNVDRDQRNLTALRTVGWRVLIVWECATRGIERQNELAAFLSAWLEDTAALGEISGQMPPENR